MTGTAGVRKILRFNWPWYAAALLVTIAVPALLANSDLSPPWNWLLFAGLGLADLWLLSSVIVSHVVYDRSALARGDWLGTAPPASATILHFGQDEATAAIVQRWPHTKRQTFDLHDPARSGSPSLRRARALARDAATPAPLDALPLANESVDLAVLAFAAHEVREASARVALARELARVIGRRGRVLLVEHLRDGWNLLAYGPGVFHFLSRSTWCATFAAAGLTIEAESRLTPWVRRFVLRSLP